MTEINVAIVGCGAVANSHFVAWRRILYAKVIAVCDSNNEAAEKAARNWRVPLKFNSVFEMIDSKVITLWDICTPIQTHKDLAIQAMKNGFDVLIEKPLTITSREAKEIVDCQKTTCKKAGVIHNCMHACANTSALSEWIDNGSCFGIDYPVNLSGLAKLISGVLINGINKKLMSKWIGTKIQDWANVVHQLETTYEL